MGEPMIHTIRWSIHGTVCTSTTLDNGKCGINDLLFTVVKHDQGAVRAVTAVAALTFDGVVQSQHGRRGIGADCLAHRKNAGRKCREEVGGLSSYGRHVVRTQPHTRDDTEGAFTADEHRRHIGAVCGSR